LIADKDYPDNVQELISFLENFEVLHKDRKRLANEVMSLAERIITEYSVIKPIEADQGVKQEVARRILELIQVDITSE
jgi:hypothetical protein